MTNDLMRDYLDGKIHVRKPFRAGRIYIAPPGTRPNLSDATGWTELDAASPEGYMHTNSGNITPWSGPRTVTLPAPMTAQTAIGCTPADPRERALRAKQVRGTGPDVPVRERGLVTKYKEKS